MAKRRAKYEYDDDAVDENEYRDIYGFFPTSKPRKADGLKAKTQRGAFGESWWGKRWIAVLEGYGIGSRLQRGRSYARGGQVLNLDIQPGKVTAQVQGSMPRPYNVQMQLPLLTDAEWAHVTEGMAAQAIFSAKLLAGEMPNEIEDVFNAAKVSLFPKTAAQLQTRCSCPDAANPCKHIAAVYYLLGEQFDADPFLIFTLRGRTRDQIIAALRALRATLAAEADVLDTSSPQLSATAPLDADLDQFWCSAGDLSTFEPTIQPPAIPYAALKRLGDSPLNTRDALRDLYDTISRAALARARGE
jgi:uncharacterized Zn finger protein